jgi:hypothetical protein
MAQKSVHSDPFRLDGVIGNFPKVFTPDTYKRNGIAQGDPYYSVEAIITAETAQTLWGIMQQVAQTGFPNGESGYQNFQWPVRSVTEVPRLAGIPELAGMYVFNAKASTKFPPSVVRVDPANPGQVIPETDQNSIQSGDILSLGLQVYTRFNPSNGVGVGLVTVLKTGTSNIQFGDGNGVDANSLYAGVQTNLPPAAPAASPQGMPPLPGQQQAPVTNPYDQQQAPVTNPYTPTSNPFQK